MCVLVILFLALTKFHGMSNYSRKSLFKLMDPESVESVTAGRHGSGHQKLRDHIPTVNIK